MNYYLKSQRWWILLGTMVMLISVACSHNIKFAPEIAQTPPKSELNIWWEKGLNFDEDLAIKGIVNDWQNQTGNKVKLSFYTDSDLTAKAERAIKVGMVPDIMMNPQAERVLYPRLAWQGKLEDVGDIIEPMEDVYADNILQGITYYNAQENKRGYYGVPIDQAAIFIYYWQQLVTAVGLESQDIPVDWSGFWQFWQKVQGKLKTEQGQNIHSLGLPVSGNKSAFDTHYLFEQILEAYDVALFDQQGRLAIARPEVRQGIINSLSWYAKLYQQGCIPANAMEWSNADNNRELLNRQVLMTPNGSLSIPATVRQDADTYYNQLGILELPHKPSGEPMRYLIFLRQAVIFQDSAHKSLAKEFLRYFIQPQVTVEYLKATGSRNQPVQNSAWSDPYWQDTQDPYIAMATKILTTGQTRLSYVADHPAYSQVLAENIWGQALAKVTARAVHPQQAADEAIAKITDIFAWWGLRD